MGRTKDQVVAGTVFHREASTEQTPLMMQYQSIKDKYQDEVLFFRLGDFYEMFNNDAIEVARLLNLTLTHRGSQPMCGIPFHAAKIYIARLLRCGKRIAICEQVSEPTGKGLAERKVIEVITPGTAVESTYLDGGSNNFLACLSVQGNETGFAFIDVTTADFFATSWKTSDMEESFLKELGRAHPIEILLPESLRSGKTAAALTVQKILGLQDRMSISYYPDWNFDSDVSFKRLTEQFRTANLKSFSLDEDSPEVSPAGFLLDYIKRTTITNAPHVAEIKVYKDKEFVIMDDSSRKNLEIIQNLNDGSSQFTLLDCLSNCQTSMGKRLLRNWLLYPLRSVTEICSRQDHIELFTKNRNLLDYVKVQFGSVLDIERLAGRIAMERAHAKDMQALRSSLELWLSVHEALSSFNFINIDVTNAEKIIELIKASILEDPATSLSEGRIIKDGWSEKLDNYRNLHNNANKILEDYAEKEKADTGITNLRIRNNSLSGYYIEITRGKTNQVPDHFILRRALTNADRYTTHRLQEIEKQINEANERILETERELFIEIRSKVAEYVPYLLETAHKVAYVDVISSLAYSATLNNWVRPLVDESFDFEVKSGRHPVVEQHLPTGEFVPNDVSISSDEKSEMASFALITGPNMAGKSTYLRQNAIIALMAQIGSFVPAEKAHIGIVDRIFCRVGASDNLARGESTFLVEMTETAYILRNATSRSLVIMDEVGRGTSTEDGLSIAWAVSEYLLNTLRCKTLFATHYHELTRIVHKSLKLLCMDVSEAEGSVVFLRRIKEGASENSYGIHVAALAGIPDTVIQRANAILAGLQQAAENKTHAIIETVEVAAETPKKDLYSSNLPGLFSDEELIIDEILSCEPDDMTPMQALKTIARWKKTLSGR